MKWQEWRKYADNETLWQDHQEKGLQKAEYLHDYVLRLWFEDDEGDYALIWLNPETGAYDEKAVDVAPECIRFFCEKYGKNLKWIICQC
jgi:hypothetical protein